MTHQDLEQRYKKNMLFIGKLDRNLFEKINNADISHLGIDITDKGINVSSHGQYLYPKDVDDAIDQQVETFLKQKTSINRKPCTFKETSDSKTHSSITNAIYNISPLKTTEHLLSYNQNPHIKSFPLLIIKGIGSGKHIEKLIEKTSIKHLIILDQDYSFFKLSMHLIDWEKIIKKLINNNSLFMFHVLDKADIVASLIINKINAQCPYKGFFILVYEHYPSNFFNQIYKTLMEKIPLLYDGWGFFDDNLLSLKRTLKNLEHNIPVYMGTNKKLPSNATLFIVASGPSIDKDIQYIKKNQNNAVIFSCGTALRVLEKNDIVPDFHFEIERGDGTHEILQQYTSQEFRDKVALIGLNVLNNKIFTEDFKEKYLYFRASDAGSSIVPDNIPKLFYTNPTVTNAAITFASEFVWDKVYLFGADMGFKDTQNHHSKDTFHYTQGEKKYNWDDHGAANITNEFPSNFGNDTVFSTRVFSWAKQTIENTINLHNLQLHNCSDGAKIEHSSPFYSKDISIVSHNKQEVISTIKSNFKDLHTHEPQFKKNYKTQVQQYHETIDILKKKLTTRDIKSFGDIFDTLDDVFELVQHPTSDNLFQHFNINSLDNILLKGTITTVLSLIYTHSMATYDLQKATQFAQDSFALLAEFLESLKKELSLKGFDL